MTPNYYLTQALAEAENLRLGNGPLHSIRPCPTVESALARLVSEAGEWSLTSWANALGWDTPADQAVRDLAEAVALNRALAAGLGPWDDLDAFLADAGAEAVA